MGWTCASASEPFELAPDLAGLKSPGHFYRGTKKRHTIARRIGWGMGGGLGRTQSRVFMVKTSGAVILPFPAET